MYYFSFFVLSNPQALGSTSTFSKELIHIGTFYRYRKVYRCKPEFLQEELDMGEG